MKLLERIDDRYIVTLTKEEYRKLKRSATPRISDTVFLQMLSPKEVIGYCRHIWKLPEDVRVETTQIFCMIQHIRRYPQTTEHEGIFDSAAFTLSVATNYPVYMKRIMVDYGRAYLLAGYCEEINTLMYYYAEKDLTSLLPWKDYVKF